MSDPEVLDRILQTCSFRSRDVVCPNKDKIASIQPRNFMLRMMKTGRCWNVPCSRTGK